MLSKYINTTKKKIVATTLAFTFAFSTSAALITSIQSNATDDIQGKSDSISEVTASDAEKAVLKASVDLVLAKTPEAKAKAEAALDDAVAKESAEDSNGSDGTSDSETKRLAKKYYEADAKFDVAEAKDKEAKDKWKSIKIEYDKIVTPAKTKWDEAVDKYEKAENKLLAINAENKAEYDVAYNEFLAADDEADKARDEYYKIKREADIKYGSAMKEAESEYLEAAEAKNEAYNEFSEVEEELIDAIEEGITTQEEIEAELAKMGLIL